MAANSYISSQWTTSGNRRSVLLIPAGFVSNSKITTTPLDTQYVRSRNGSLPHMSRISYSTSPCIVRPKKCCQRDYI